MNPHSKYCRAAESARIQLRALLLVVLAAAPASAEDWPVVRGDTMGTGVARSALPEKLDVLWMYKAAEDAGFDATAVVKDDIVYLGDSAGTFHAVHVKDGTAAWTKQFTDLGFAAGAAVDKDRIYVGDMDGVVRCLAMADGKELWTYKLEAEVFAGPTPHGDDVLVTSESGTLACLNAADGKERWKPFQIDAPLRCSPTISAGHVMLAGCDSLLHIINVSDGSQKHTVDIDGPTGSTPAMLGERVFFGTEGGTFYAIDIPADTTKKPAVAWTYHDKRRGQPIRSAAAVTEDVLVYGSQGKAIYALDPKTSDEKWVIPTRSRVESSPVIAGNLAIAATTAGKLYLIEVPTGEVKYENDFGGSFIASPAVVAGKIIIGNTDGTLYCLGTRHESDKPTAKD
jgi:outer membrane protein assembly factor BamB